GVLSRFESHFQLHPSASPCCAARRAWHMMPREYEKRSNRSETHVVSADNVCLCVSGGADSGARSLCPRATRGTAGSGTTRSGAKRRAGPASAGVADRPLYIKKFLQR